MVGIGKENESAVLAAVKNSGKSLKYIPSGWKIQIFKIDYLPFYSRGLGELEGVRNLLFWTERTEPDIPWPGV